MPDFLLQFINRLFGKHHTYHPMDSASSHCIWHGIELSATQCLCKYRRSVYLFSRGWKHSYRGNTHADCDFYSE